MERKIILVLGVLSMTTAVAIGFMTTRFTDVKDSLFATRADDDLAFSLTSANAPTSYGTNVSVVSTRKGNALKFNYVGASSEAGAHAKLVAGGYIQNVEELLDLNSLTVRGSGSFKLHTGIEGYSKVQAFDLEESDRTFPLSNVSYFKLEAVSASIIESIDGDFTCSKTEYPPLNKVSVNGQWNYAKDWNILCHDIDPTQEFDFEFSIRQVYTGTDRVQRPRLFIANADGLYDDNYDMKTLSERYCLNAYYAIRQDSYQTTYLAGTATEKAVGNVDSWLSASTATKNAVNYGDNANFATVSSDATVTFTCTLRNEEGGGQTFRCVMLIDTNVEGKNDITITYTITRAGGIIFDSSNICLGIIVGGWGSLTTYDLVSTSSSGVR